MKVVQIKLIHFFLMAITSIKILITDYNRIQCYKTIDSEQQDNLYEDIYMAAVLQY